MKRNEALNRACTEKGKTTMASKAVIKKEQLQFPPGFSPKPELRYGVAANSSPSDGAFNGGDKLNAPTHNQIKSLMQQGSKPAKSDENCTNCKRETREAPLPETLRLSGRRRSRIHKLMDSVMTGKGKSLMQTAAAAAADLEAERQGERMTAPTRSKRAAAVGTSGGHADNGPSHAPIHDYAEVEEAIEPAAEIEVVVPRGGRGGRGRVQANPDLLNGPYPGGPEIHTLIPSFKSHIAAYIWNGEERLVGRAESRINSLKKFTYGNIEKGLAPLGIDVQADKDYLQMTGLFDLQHSFLSPVDAPLLFVERWQPETNSFHITWGEMTITLHDVQKILGASVEGHVVSSSFDEDTERAHCVYLLSEMMDLGLDEVEEVWKKGGPTWRMIYDQLLMPGQSMTRRVQSYLTFLIGATLFPDKSCDRIKPWYMRILDEPELKNVGNYSWGSACLAYLYRELRICSRAMSKGL